jgi:two-component system LytT family response regulator
VNVNGESSLRSLDGIAVVEAPVLDILSAPLRVVVAEPDAVSRRLICSLLESELIMVVDSSHVQVLHTIKKNFPDVLVADVRALSPLEKESLSAFGDLPSATIVTGYDPADLAAFAPIAIDLLVKPFSAERFDAALDAARARVAYDRAESASARSQSGSQRDLPSQQFLERLVVESDHKILLIRVEDIDWIQSFGDYVRLHAGNACHLLRRTMKTLQTQLDPKTFLRVHRNAMVNLDRVKEFYLPPEGNMFVTLNTGVSLPLRRHNRSSLRKLLKDLL